MNKEVEHQPLFPRANQLVRNLLWAAAGGAVVYGLVVLKILPVIQLAGGGDAG